MLIPETFEFSFSSNCQVLTRGRIRMELTVKLAMILVVYLTSVSTKHQVFADGEWNYDDQSNWKCDATRLRQSPIDIDTNHVSYQNHWRLDFINYDQEVEFNLKNTHHSVSMEPVRTENHPTIGVNWVDNGCEYELKEIHFHWGDGERKGSEHEINDQRAAAEMHMVHYKKGLEKEQIGHVENSVVVVGVFIESDNIEHNKLDGLVSSASKVNGTDEEKQSDKPEYLINLLPDNKDSFFTYNGSLTTPPCYEVVTWVLMSQPVYMSQDKLTELSHFAKKGSKDYAENIGPNYREIQPLLDRPVYSSYNVSTAISTKGQTKRSSMGKFTAALERHMPDFKRVHRILEKAMGVMKKARNFVRLHSFSSSSSKASMATDG